MNGTVIAVTGELGVTVGGRWFSIGWPHTRFDRFDIVVRLANGHEQVIPGTSSTDPLPYPPPPGSTVLAVVTVPCCDPPGIVAVEL